MNFPMILSSSIMPIGVNVQGDVQGNQRPVTSRSLFQVRNLEDQVPGSARPRQSNRSRRYPLRRYPRVQKKSLHALRGTSHEFERLRCDDFDDALS